MTQPDATHATNGSDLDVSTASGRRGPTQDRPKDHATTDSFGRRIDYLRISVTDRCNLRCIYCMPTHPIPFAPSEDLLTADELRTVAQAAAELGFRKVRLTGGEPTLRNDIVEIVEAIAEAGIADLAMTTNGLRMPEIGGALREAGLDRVNVHIDSLNPERLPALMRWGSAEDLWRGLLACETAEFDPIKVNTVVVRGHNEDDVVDLARLSLDRPWTVRFIELMPLGRGAEAQVAVDRLVPSEEVAERISGALGPLTPVPNADPSDEARNFRLPDAKGKVGFISPVSDPYCDTCNRMRLTADGRLHLCLLHDDELDLRGVLRAGGGLEEVREALGRAVAAKPWGHALHAGVHTQDRRMHAIGG